MSWCAFFYNTCISQPVFSLYMALNIYFVAHSVIILRRQTSYSSFLLDKSNEVEKFEDFFKQGIDPECREHPPLSAMRRSPSHCRSVFGIRSAVGGRRSRSAAGFSDRECRAPRPTLSSSLRLEARGGRF
jgi:hypothetical protein